MKKNKAFIEMKSSVKVSLKILPFGNLNFEITGLESPVEEKEIKKPRYIEPITTNIEKVKIRYEESGTYSVPRTTA